MELISQKSELSLKSVKLIQPILPLMNLLRLNSRNCLPISRIFGKFFPKLLSRLDHSFKCEDTNLSLLEKSHLMVKEGIGPSTGHKISKKGIEVRQSKIEVICKIPSLHHRQKELGVFLEYSILFRRLAFELFQTLRDRLTEAPILGIAPQTGHLPFELMCDASDFAIGAVLGQRHEKHFRPIHYASKTLIEAQTNYTTTEKELLAIVYAFEKFRKGCHKARLLRWFFLLQEFDFKVMILNEPKNLRSPNHHVQMEKNPYENVNDPKEINESFPLETLNMVTFRGDV
ncbi:reverse transcriptase domain-containing protein [Tanacetum coccineum]